MDVSPGFVLVKPSLGDTSSFLNLFLNLYSLWAQARRQGQGVADPKELDGDVILAAQARQVGAVVITENIGHLAQFVTAYDWRDTPVADLTS